MLHWVRITTDKGLFVLHMVVTSEGAFFVEVVTYEGAVVRAVPSEGVFCVKALTYRGYF